MKERINSRADVCSTESKGYINGKLSILDLLSNALHLFDDEGVLVVVDKEDKIGIDDAVLRQQAVPPFPAPS